MSSIDNFNLDLHSRYAIDTATTELFKQDYHIDDLVETRAVSDHAKVLDYVPKPAAFDWLFGIDQTRRWAYFNGRKSFTQNRVFFFSSEHSIEKCQADLMRVANVDCAHADPAEKAQREKEKEILTNFNKLLGNLYEDYEYIMGRTHHFVQA